MSISIFLKVVIFLLPAFNVSCSACHLVINSFSFWISENIFISPLFVKKYFHHLRTPRWLFCLFVCFPFNTLKILPHCYLVYIFLIKTVCCPSPYFCSSISNVCFSSAAFGIFLFITRFEKCYDDMPSHNFLDVSHAWSLLCSLDL